MRNCPHHSVFTFESPESAFHKGCPRFSKPMRVLAALWGLLALAGLVSAADAPASTVRGKTRFQVLAPNLIRMEYSPKSRFVDEASVAVVGRDDWKVVAPQIQEKDGWLSLSTAELVLRYKLESGPFSEANLQITWKDKAGERSWKPGDKDDKNLGGIPGTMDNRSMVTVIDPGPLTRNGYWFLNDSQTALFDKAADWVKPRPEDDSQDWYVLVYGNDYAGALQSMAKLVGRIPMLPRYAFGAWFGSRAPYSDAEWKMIVDQFRDERLPLDMVVLDSFSTTKMIWEGYEWDYEQMPDPKGFFEWMNHRNVQVTVNEHYNPLTRDNDANFDAIRKAMGMPEDTKAIPHDIGNKQYAGLFMDLLHKPALDMGMAFWWQDGCAAASVKGLDPFLWTRHIEYVGSEKATGKRTTAFCRLGPGVGSHRYGIFFTGDLTGMWETLPVMVPATIRGGNQLMPYMNNLCGGVFTVDLPAELYQRCVQFASLSPTVWFHGLWGLRLPWEYGRDGMDTYRQFVGLRYALLPYIYTYSRIAHDTGLPLVRGMYLEFPDQEQAYASNQQYMFGKELLVAPVTKPGNGKPVPTDVTLPAENDWYDYFTGDLYEGGRQIVHECPIDRMPVFARAGSIVPTGPKMEYSSETPLDPLTLDVYAGRRGAEFKLYEDDGTSLDYRKNACAWTTFAFQPTNGSGDYALTVSPADGKYAGQIAQRRYVVRVHGLLKPSRVVVHGADLPEIGEDACGGGWLWDAKSRVTTIRLPAAVSTSQAAAVEIQGAGTFADAVVLQKALNLRDQVRQAKRMMKVKHADVSQCADIKKPPRVIRKTEEVERELTTLVNHPSGLGNTPPDFKALRQRVVEALNDKPFESDRTIPEADPLAIATTKKIENCTFTPEEKDAIAKILRGADVP